MKHASGIDMKLLGKIYGGLFCRRRFSDAEKLPIAFTYGGKRYTGIPEGCVKSFETKLVTSAMSVCTLKAEIAPELEVTAEITEYRDFPVVETIVYFSNPSDRDSDILERADAFCGVIEGIGSVIHGNGDTCGEDGYEFFKTDLCDSSVSLVPRDGTPCCGAFPYMRLLGEGWGVNLAVGWPAMWRADISAADGGAFVSVGQKRLHTVVRPGETLRTPRVTLMAFFGGESEGINLWRAWYFAHILPKENGAPIPPKVCMHTWMAEGRPEFTGITEQNQLDGIDDYLLAGAKPDIWWIDAGWYPCDYNWPHIGTWKCDESRLPNGLTPVGRKCEENGIQLLLWFEPERVVEGTQLFKEHPEWLLRIKSGEGYNRNNLLDLGNAECCDWLIEYVNGFIDKNKVGIYRQDFNFDPEPYWKANESEDRIGAMENLHVQGYLRYYDSLILRHPGLWIDSCASGGRRNELETMRRAVTLHYTDVGYGNHPIKQKQHREMFEWLPYFRAHTMSWDNAEGTYSPAAANHIDEFAYYNAFAPAITDMVEHDADAEAFALSDRMRRIWRRAAELMLGSDYYPLSERTPGLEDFYAMQFDDTEKREGFIEVVTNTGCRLEEIVLSPHVERGCVYLLENEHGEKMTLGSDEFAAFSVSLASRSAVVWFYRVCDVHGENT